MSHVPYSVCIRVVRVRIYLFFRTQSICQNRIHMCNICHHHGFYYFVCFISEQNTYSINARIQSVKHINCKTIWKGLLVKNDSIFVLSCFFLFVSVLVDDVQNVHGWFFWLASGDDQIYYTYRIECCVCLKYINQV